jgi:zinc transport system ATP-binding protein
MNVSLSPAAEGSSYVGPAHVGDEAICIDGLTFRYPDGTLALETIDLHVAAGSTLAVIGPNGAGKTTLLKILLGVLHGYEGQVLVAGMSPGQARHRGDVVSWVPQRQSSRWDFPLTVRQVVRMGLVGRTGMFRRHSREDLDTVERIMEVLGVQAIAERCIGELSGGQQQLAVIARALAPHPAILMLDEPTVGVDQAGQERFVHLTQQLRRQFGLTLVIVSHDLRTVLNTCQRIVCLNRTLHFHDAPERLSSELLFRVFNCSLKGVFPVTGEQH